MFDYGDFLLFALFMALMNLLNSLPQPFVALIQQWIDVLGGLLRLHGWPI